MVKLDCAHRYATAKFCNKIIQMRPFIVNHNCYNDGSERFGQCMKGTSLIHLFEHIIIDFMLDESVGESFSGVSRWIDESQGTGLIRINFYHDTQALVSISKATKVFNSVVCTNK